MWTKLIRMIIIALMFVGLMSSLSVAGAVHYDFTYPNRASLIAAGWDFTAKTWWSNRNTEQTSGAVVSYDQVAHPGILRIPADTGDLWAGWNNSRNTLFRNLPSNWTSIRLKLSFAPTQDYQQAGLLAYQNDDTYVQVTRGYNSGNKMIFVRETSSAASVVNSVTETATNNLHLRLDRNPVSQEISAYYSLDGMNWVSLGSVIQTLTNPRLGIFTGASPGGFPNADLQWAEVFTG
jgi:regulation of enolase protein 1 (concanavalin A-like superfamily)